MYDIYAELEYQVHKVKIEVEIELEGGRTLLGNFFGAPKQRLSDVLNDERRFLPFETSGGILTVFRKSAVLRITPLRQSNRSLGGKDPYEIRGVSKTASDDEVKEVYYRLSRTTHPDRLIALGLPKEFVALANERMARVNDAYARIVKERESGKLEPARAEVA